MLSWVCKLDVLVALQELFNCARWAHTRHSTCCF